MVGLTKEFLESRLPQNPKIFSAFGTYSANNQTELWTEFCATVDELGLEPPEIVNIGFPEDRRQRIWDAIEQATEAALNGRDIIIHCEHGRHRAVILFCIFWMFWRREPWERAVEVIVGFRPIAEPDDAIEPSCNRRGTW